MKYWIKRHWKAAATLVGTLLLLCLLALPWLLTHHLVRSDHGWLVVSKRYLTLNNACVDIRNWDWERSQAYPDLCAALTQAGYAALLPQPPPPPSRQERLAASWNAFQENVAATWHDLRCTTTNRLAAWSAAIEQKWF